MNIEKIMPTFDIVKNFIDTNFSSNEIKSDALSQKVLNAYKGEKVVFDETETKVYNAFNDFYKNSNVVFLTRALSSLLNNIDESIENCDSLNHEKRKIPLDSVSNLLSNINFSERFLLNKRVALNQEINNILSSKKFNDYLLNTKSKFNAKNIKNVEDFYLGNNDAPLNHIENVMYSQLSNKMKKIEAIDKYDFGRLNDEINFMLKSLNINSDALPNGKIYNNLHFNISSLYTDDELKRQTQQDLDTIRAYVEGKVIAKTFKKLGAKVQYSKEKNAFDSKNIYIATDNLKSYENDEYKNIMESINILYTYNLKNAFSLLEDNKDFNNYIKANLKDYVMNEKELQQLQQYDFSKNQEVFVQAIALIDTLNMSKMFLNRNSLEVVEKNLTSLISNSLLDLSCTDIDKFNFYFDRINKIVKASTNENFAEYKDELKSLTENCKNAFAKLGKNAQVESQIRMKVVNDLSNVLSKRYSFEGNESTQAKSTMKNIIQKQSNSKYLTDELANRLVLLKLTEMTKNDISELKKSLTYLGLTTKSYFYNMFINASSVSKMTAKEFQSKMFASFKAILENKGFSYDDNCTSFTDLLFGAQSRAEDSSLIKYYSNGVLSGNLFDLIEGAEIEIDDKLNFNSVLNASMDKFNYTKSMIMAGELKKSLDLFNTTSLTDKQLSYAIARADEISKDKNVIDSTVDTNFIVNTVLEKINAVKEEKNVHICATNGELVSIAKDLGFIKNINETLTQLKETNSNIRANIQTLNKEDFSKEKLGSYRQLCKSSISKKLSNALAKGLGAHNVVVKNFDRNKNPELIFANFPEFSDSDKKQLANVISNIARFYSVTDKNKNTIHDEGNFFSVINLISNTLKTLSETILRKIESSADGKYVIPGSAKSKDYSLLNQKVNELISEFVEKEYGKTFSAEESLDYFVDKMIIDVAQSYQQSKSEKQSVRELRNNLKTNVLDKMISQFEKEVEISNKNNTTAVNQIEMIK